MKNSSAAAGLTLVAAAAAFLGVSAATGSDDAKPSTNQVAVQDHDGLSNTALTILKSRDGQFTPTPGNKLATLSKEEAVRLAGNDFGFLSDDTKSVSAELGLFTDGQYGKPNEDPKINDRLVWLVEVSGFTMPEFGPMQLPGQDAPEPTPTPARTGGSDALVYIDAVTSEVLGATQYSSHLEDNDLNLPDDPRRTKD